MENSESLLAARAWALETESAIVGAMSALPLKSQQSLAWMKGRLSDALQAFDDSLRRYLTLADNSDASEEDLQRRELLVDLDLASCRRVFRQAVGLELAALGPEADADPNSPSGKTATSLRRLLDAAPSSVQSNVDRPAGRDIPIRPEFSSQETAPKTRNSLNVQFEEFQKKMLQILLEMNAKSAAPQTPAPAPAPHIEVHLPPQAETTRIDQELREIHSAFRGEIAGLQHSLSQLFTQFVSRPTPPQPPDPSAAASAPTSAPAPEPVAAQPVLPAQPAAMNPAVEKRLQAIQDSISQMAVELMERIHAPSSKTSAAGNPPAPAAGGEEVLKVLEKLQEAQRPLQAQLADLKREVTHMASEMAVQAAAIQAEQEPADRAADQAARDASFRQEFETMLHKIEDRTNAEAAARDAALTEVLDHMLQKAEERTAAEAAARDASLLQVLDTLERQTKLLAAAANPSDSRTATAVEIESIIQELKMTLEIASKTGDMTQLLGERHRLTTQIEAMDADLAALASEKEKMTRVIELLQSELTPLKEYKAATESQLMDIAKVEDELHSLRRESLYKLRELREATVKQDAMRLDQIVRLRTELGRLRFQLQAKGVDPGPDDADTDTIVGIPTEKGQEPLPPPQQNS